MDDFSNSYDKLINMGFQPKEVHAAIDKGYYNFKQIFHYLVSKEKQRLTETNKESKDSNSGIDDITKDLQTKVSSIELSADTNTIKPIKFLTNGNCATRKSFYQTNSENKPEIPSVSLSTSNLDNLESKVHFDKRKSILNLTDSKKPLSYQNNYDKNKMVLLQICDLLESHKQPITYSQSFIKDLCTVRDVISWFHKARCVNYSAMGSSLGTNPGLSQIGSSSFQPINSEFSCVVSLDRFIDLFRKCKWRFVCPSYSPPEMNTTLKYDQINCFLNDLGIDNRVHLVAIISFDHLTQLGSKRQLSNNSSTDQSNNQVDNSNSIVGALSQTSTSNVTVNCPFDPPKPLHNINNNYVAEQGSYQVQIQILDEDFNQSFTNDNPFYLVNFPGPNFSKYYPFATTTIQQVLLDFKLSLPPSKYISTNQFQLIYHPSAITITNHNTLTNTCFTGDSSTTSINYKLSQFQMYNKLTLAQLGLNSHCFFFCVQNNCPDGSSFLPVTSSSLQNLSLQVIQIQLLKSETNRELVNSFLLQKNLHKLNSELQTNLIKYLITSISQQKIKYNFSEILGKFCNSQSKLTHLDLSYSTILDNECMKVIGRCRYLQELILDNNEVNTQPKFQLSNEGLWYIRSCADLRRLSISHCASINDWGVQLISELAQLSWLSVRATSMTNIGLRHLQMRVVASGTQLTKLSFVDFGSLCLTDDCLDYITEIMPNIESLILSNTYLIDPSRLPLLPNLKHLDLSNCPDLQFSSKDHIRSLINSCPQLTSVVLTGLKADNLMHATLAVSRCHNLHKEHGLMTHPNMTHSLANTLFHLPLHTLNLSNCAHVTDDWLPLITRLAGTLAHLSLAHCQNIHGTHPMTLYSCITRLHSLMFLDLSHLHTDTDKQIIDIVLSPHSFPLMKLIWISLPHPKTNSDITNQIFNSNNSTTKLHYKINITSNLF